MELKGYLGFKGERGYSAYEIAVQQGFKGTINDWLASIGTASHFKEESVVYTATKGQKEFALPNMYTENSFIDIYIEGRRFNSNQYTVDKEARKIILNTPIDVEGTIIEVVVLTMSTNNLPIVETLNEESTNDTAPGTKAVYDLFKGLIDDETLSNDKTYSNNKINDLVNTIYNNMMDYYDDMFNKNNIQVVTSVAQSIGAGATKIIDIPYPIGFTKSNTSIISKMVSSNNVYYDTNKVEATASGFPEIDMIALTDDVIRVWVVNSSTEQTRNGYVKITLMKIEE